MEDLNISLNVEHISQNAIKCGILICKRNRSLSVFLYLYLKHDGMSKILIVDDERAIRRALREILEFEEFEVDEAENGKIGLDMAKVENYDIIFCDIKMPEMDLSLIHLFDPTRLSRSSSAVVCCQKTKYTHICI